MMQVRSEDTSVRRFKPYAAYRDAGVEWGRVPSHWRVKRWRYCCRITGTAATPKGAPVA